MTMLDINALRARLKEENENRERAKNGDFQNQPDAFLAFWNIALGERLNLRFLPDANQNNPFFWQEISNIEMPFNGIKGKSFDPITVKIPCSELWEKNSCPVHAELRTWYKSTDESIKKLASKYWMKKKFLLQCFIAPNSCAVDKDNPPLDNPIRRVLINNDLLIKIKSIIMNPECPELPIHYERGRDFAVVKAKGTNGYYNYDESVWSMNERPLNEVERNAINTHGLFDLSTFMPKRPTDEEKLITYQMFEASLRGDAYDPDLWAQYYRPNGVSKPNNTDSTVVPPASTQQTVVPQQTTQSQLYTAQPAVQTAVQPNVQLVPEQAPTAMDPANLIAQLRNQNNAAASTQPATDAVQPQVASPAATTASPAELIARLRGMQGN